MAVIAIVGGGTGGLLLAAMLSARHDVHMYEKGRLVGRKLLVAGNGGFNLTHSNDGEDLVASYTPSEWMRPYLLPFGSRDFRSWLSDIGIETYVGSSSRVFPVQGIKPAAVLKAILSQVRRNGTTIHTQHQWVGQSDNQLRFETSEGLVSVEADIIVYALGGASWTKTGSDGVWLPIFEGIGVDVKPFGASNCGWHIDHYEPPSTVQWTPLKNIACRTTKEWCRGELMLTDYGIEGSPLYKAMQDAHHTVDSLLWLDLKPDVDSAKIEQVLMERGRKSIKDVLLQRLHFTPGMHYLITQYTTRDQYTDPSSLATLIRALPLPLTRPRPIDESISTTGGVCVTAVNKDLDLKYLANTYVMGEMLDWDAPTGGYLIQGCASMAAFLARHLDG